jgi:hypothetical protein
MLDSLLLDPYDAYGGTTMRRYILGIVCFFTTTHAASEEYEQPKFIEPASLDTPNFSEPCPPFKDEKGRYILVNNPHDLAEKLQFTCNLVTTSSPLFLCPTETRATLENTTLNGISLFFWQRLANGTWRGNLLPSLSHVRLFGHCRPLPPH